MVFKNLVQKVLLFVILFGGIQNSFGQLKTDVSGSLKTDGPINVKSGTMVKIAISGLEGMNDPKILCYPESSEWFAGKDFAGNNPMIVFFPSKDVASGKTYTFVIAGNKDNKTLLLAHTVIVDGGVVPVPPGPAPVPPGPEPTPGKYTEQFKAPYLVNPDEESLNKLIGVYEAMATQAKDMTSYKQMWDVLNIAASKALNDPNRVKIVGVRDKAAEILQSDLANRNSETYDINKTKQVFTDLANSLKALRTKKASLEIAPHLMVTFAIAGGKY